MERIQIIQFGWTQLFWISLLLTLIFLLMYFVHRILASVVIIGGWRSVLKEFLSKAIILYEPIALLLIVSIFIVINPGFHGLICLLLIIISIKHLRNYINGKIIRTYRSIQLGRKLNIGQQDGIITDMGRFGLRIRSDEGLHYIPYHTLMD